MDIKLFKPGVILFIISVVAGLSLASVYDITAEARAEAAAKAKQEAMEKILPTAETFIDITGNVQLENPNIYTVVSCESANGIEGYIVGTITSGYGGEMRTLTAFNNEGIIQNIYVVSHKETPGLGALATENEFSDQYINKTAPLAVVKGEAKAENEISAITGSTITTNGVTDGVNIASEYFNQFMEGGN